MYSCGEHGFLRELHRPPSPIAVREHDGVGVVGNAVAVDERLPHAAQDLPLRGLARAGVARDGALERVLADVDFHASTPNAAIAAFSFLGRRPWPNAIGLAGTQCPGRRAPFARPV